MLKNTQINRLATIKIARALEELNDQVVYVGGAIVSLYIDDPTADDVRPTKDIDISMDIVNFGALEALREKLISKGFYQTSDDNVNCRFRYEDLKVDVMSTKEIGWAPTNPWFGPGFNKAKQIAIEDQKIKILTLPYFLASKFTAFYGRGINDPRSSHDYEDIVYLMNYISNFYDQIIDADHEVQQYLKEVFSNILESDILQEAIIGNLYYEDQMKRSAKIIDTLKRIVNDI